MNPENYRPRFQIRGVVLLTFLLLANPSAGQIAISATIATASRDQAQKQEGQKQEGQSQQGQTQEGQNQGQKNAPPPTPRHTGVRATLRALVGDFEHLPSRENLVIAGLGGGLALLVHPVDDDLNVKLRGSELADDVFDPGKVIGYGVVQVGAALSTYIVGRATGRKKISHLGMDLLRAQMVAQALTYGLKTAVRRDRPGGDCCSFPSGHASVTFASATIIERHLGWRIAVPPYLIASYVAASRLHENRHFLSDVVFGSAIGLIAGRTVVASHAGRWEYTLVPEIGPGRAAILIVKTASR